MVNLVKLFHSFMVKHLSKRTILMVRFTVMSFTSMMSFTTVMLSFIVFITVMVSSMKRATRMVSHELFLINFINFRPVFRSFEVLVPLFLMMLILVVLSLRFELTIVTWLHKVSRAEVTIRVLLLQYLHIVRRGPDTDMVSSAQEHENRHDS